MTATLHPLPFLAADGATQMALDEHLYARVQREQASAFVRLYVFDPPCISLGYFQRIAAIDADAARARGLDLVRRPSGGRAVLHRDALTYAVTAGAGSPLHDGGLDASMRRVADALADALAAFGLVAALESGRGGASGGGGGACFDSPSLYELRLGVRKLAGSAQLRGKDGFLQHGAIPIRYDDAENRELLRAPSAGHAACAPFLADPAARDRFFVRFVDALARRNGLAVTPDPDPAPLSVRAAAGRTRYADAAHLLRR